MENGKLKQALTVAMAVLCVMLLVMNGRMARRVDQLEVDVSALQAELKYRIRELEITLENRFSAELKKKESAVKDWRLEPVGPDAAAKTIRCRVAVDLKEWQADTAVTLYFTAGGDAKSLPMTQGENGTFSAEIALSETAKMPLELKVEIRSGETIRQEELGRWSELGTLLPVRLSSWGGSKPQYVAGSLMLGPMHFTVEDKDYRQAKLDDTEIRVYRNGEMAMAIAAPAGSQSAAGPGGWSYEVVDEVRLDGCKDGDTGRLTAVGVDAYGLGYEFILCDWAILDGKLTQSSPAVSPILFWK